MVISSSMTSTGIHATEPHFKLHGIFIHPSHYSSSSLDEAPSPTSSSSSYGDVDDEDEDDDADEPSLPSVEELSLAPMAPPSTFWLNNGETLEPAGMDYFSCHGTSSSSTLNSSIFSASFDYDDEDSSSKSYSTKSTTSCNSSLMYKSSPSSSFQAPGNLSRHSSYSQIYSADMVSPTFPATLSFSTFAPVTPALDERKLVAPILRRGSSPAGVPTSVPMTSSPMRVSPYSRRHGGASMTRSVSSPVETQKQMDHRQTMLTNVSAVMDERASMMARSVLSSSSSPSLVGMGIMEGGIPMGLTTSTPTPQPTTTTASTVSPAKRSVSQPGVTRSRSSSMVPTVKPLRTPFGEAWLEETKEFQLSCERRSIDLSLSTSSLSSSSSSLMSAPHQRFSRSHSVGNIENLQIVSSARRSSGQFSSNAVTPSFLRHNSLPTTHVPFPPTKDSMISTSSTTSQVMTRPRRGTLLTPMTPIIPPGMLVGGAE